MTPILVTGTDTGVGKTFITCALLRCLRARGYNPFPLKLVEGGRKRFRFALGNGKAQLELESFQGTITLRRPGAGWKKGQPPCADDNDGYIHVAIAYCSTDGGALVVACDEDVPAVRDRLG